jgi:uncharacterized protein YecE (DUF72 family)
VNDAREILFGIAGWSYEDWKDVVYPRGCKDTLRFVAERVGLIEINSTFYRPPSAKNCASWVTRTEDLGTKFTAKLPMEFTHDGACDEALVQQTRGGFAPLAESGRLVALLAQTNFRVQATPNSVAHFARLRDAFADVAPLVVEVRHQTWNVPRAMEEMRKLGVTVAELDYPGAASGFSLDVTGVRAGGLAYFRLHGRNAAWFQKGASRDEVYDWEYSASEVKELEQRLLRIAHDATRTLVVANNHFHGKAMKVVKELVAWYRGMAAKGDEGNAR